jgi:phosphoribosyl 1,2-cyclic phosphate phosphodiesterase
MKTKITIMGCGTSGGVPRVGNVWGDCDPLNPKNRRRRVSILVERGDSKLIVDTSPDLREQLLAADVQRLDGVLYSHDHADHTHGIDDLRGLYHNTGEKIKTYSDAKTLELIKAKFGYIFESQRGYPAICHEQIIDGNFSVGEIEVEPIEQIHGPITSLGFRFGNVAYSTDVNDFSPESFAKLKNLDVWIVDALRYKPHPTHAHLERTLNWIERLKPKRAILTHMAWELDYETLCKELPDGVEPGYDGLTIEV